MKKSQVSVEYTMLVGFIFVITLPLIILFLTYSNESSMVLNTNQLSQIARQITDAADTVHFIGEPSMTTIKIYLPSNLESASLNGRELQFQYGYNGKISDIVSIANVNMSGSLPITQGTHKITVRSVSGYVNISTT